MHRKNFGRVSGIILDQCPKHGIFLDADSSIDAMEHVFLRRSSAAFTNLRARSNSPRSRCHLTRIQ